MGNSNFESKLGQKDGATAVLLLAHGSPDRPEDVPEFLNNVTGGRAIPSELVDEITHRYGLIGRSPLTALTLKQGELLARELRLPVYVGMRNWKPYITDAIRSMTAARVESTVVICMAPQNSRTSVGLYKAFVTKENVPFAIEFVESWHDHPLLIEAFSEKLLCGWGPACREFGGSLPVIFTAHSVPERTIVEGDPYRDQAMETALLVANRASLPQSQCSFAFQSQGASGGSWIGPTVESTILRLKGEGHRGVFIQPIGFLCDHVEVLYDIDVVFKGFAESEGMRLWRAQSLNDSRTLISALADLARSQLALGHAEPRCETRF